MHANNSKKAQQEGHKTPGRPIQFEHFKCSHSFSFVYPVFFFMQLVLQLLFRVFYPERALLHQINKRILYAIGFSSSLRLLRSKIFSCSKRIHICELCEWVQSNVHSTQKEWWSNHQIWAERERNRHFKKQNIPGAKKVNSPTSTWKFNTEKCIRCRPEGAFACTRFYNRTNTNNDGKTHAQRAKEKK